ncbi:hypothetical protein J3R82DRAFT_6040 [Butyriboletus roseoflavus]|nr:hypothetical protein J3R82DRAFT_6040 [Butyriboletus roseoflavus]
MTMASGRDLHWPSLALLVTGLLSVGPRGILAQTSSVVCGSSYNWVRRSYEGDFTPTVSSQMINSLGQTPCTVAAYLLSTCNNGQYTVFPLASNAEYSGPGVGEGNTCICNSITYCTMSACAACQDHGYVG